jgi:two-component system response regulator AtoC
MSITIQVIVGKETEHSGLITFLKERGCRVISSPTATKALRQMKKEKPDAVFLALDIPNLRGPDILQKMRKNGDCVHLFTIVKSNDQGIETLQWGAEYYFLDPCNSDEVSIILQKFLAAQFHQQQVERLRHWFLHQLEGNEIISVSKSMEELYRQVVAFSKNGTGPVMLLGEVGTGKEFLAKVIHLRSPYFMLPFVTVNCNKKQTQLLDKYLVDIQKTGDGRRKESENFQHAEGGTLLLHNIESLPKSAQTRVLNYLKNKKIKRGKKAEKSVRGMRIIASTSANLKTLVDKGKFNKELYKALNKSSIHIPPLKKRTSEIIHLATHFIKRFNQKYGKHLKKIDADVRHYLESYDWPGNVSELKNVIEHVVIIAQGETITMKEMEFKRDRKVLSLDSLLMNGSFLSLDEMATLYVKTVLKRVKGNKSKAAKLLGVSRNTLKKKSVVI